MPPHPRLNLVSMTLKKSLKSLKKQTKLSGYEQDEIEAFELQKSDKQKTKCSDTSIYSVESEDSAWQQSDLGEYRQLSLWKSTPTHSLSSDTISQESPSTQTSLATNQNQENLTSLQWVSPAREQATQELGQDSNILLHLFGEKDLDALSKLNPSSVLWNSLKELSDEDLELFLPPSIWQDTLLKLKQSRQQALALDNRGTDCLSFPTLTSGQTSTKMRPAGQVKCEKWFKDNGLIPTGSQLSAQAMALIMGFPLDWFSPLSPVEHQEELEPDISQDEQLHQHRQQLPSEESYISIPCLVKQPGKPELKGLIRKDEGDCFLVSVEGKKISISKLFVYPDFSESVGQIEKTPRKNITPSKNNPRKNRRKKGQGNGTIYYRTATKNGKQYQEAYYHYIDNGKKRTKYIPKKLLGRVKEAESLKLPVGDILILLGGDRKNPRKSSSTLSTSVDEKLNDSCVEQVLETNDLNPRKTTPPSNKKRKQGYGTGYIECKPITRNGKQYKQYWYHYEEWRSGDCLRQCAERNRTVKKSRYIPKRLVARVEKLEAEKVSVRKILEVLISKDKVRQK